MNYILSFAVISVLAAAILLIGANAPVFAQENMTMNNSSVPGNTSEINTGTGMDTTPMLVGNDTDANITTTQ